MSKAAGEREEITYRNYLKVEELLQCQIPISDQHGRPAHDEHLFIITHQAFELWFKQALVELDSVRDILSKPIKVDSQMLTLLSRLGRVVLILKLLPEQFHILETMSPLDFLEFRGYLSPASGFQSLQFRLLENKLGVKESYRNKYNKEEYSKCFKDDAAKAKLKESLEQPTLLERVQTWLEWVADHWDETYWQEYKKKVHQWLEDTNCKPGQAEMNEETRKKSEEDLQKKKDGFESIFNKEKYEQGVNDGLRRMSHKAFRGAMLIALYRKEPRFNQPYKLLTLLMDIDALVAKWRHIHVMMVQRMIGYKVGTGGSSGYEYLRSTNCDEYRVFVDLFNISTYYIPQDYVPPITVGQHEA